MDDLSSLHKAPDLLVASWFVHDLGDRRHTYPFSPSVTMLQVECTPVTGVGVSGVNRATTILPVKWVGPAGNGATSDLLAGLDWLPQAQQAGVNIRVINDSTVFVGTAYSQALSDEIDRLGQHNILFVTAAGNTGDNNDTPAVRRYPCGYDRPRESCVAASEQNDALPSWANYGPTTVNLAAPGTNIYSMLRGASYGFINGSSMASPQVAGAAALILSVQNLSATQLKADILEHVDVTPGLSGLVRTGGWLDICKALPGCVLPPPAVPTNLTAYPTDCHTVSLAWSTPGRSVDGINVYRDGSAIAHLGNVTSYQDTGLGENSSHTCAVSAVLDGVESGQSSAISVMISACQVTPLPGPTSTPIPYPTPVPTTPRSIVKAQPTEIPKSVPDGRSIATSEATPTPVPTRANTGISQSSPPQSPPPDFPIAGLFVVLALLGLIGSAVAPLFRRHRASSGYDLLW